MRHTAFFVICAIATRTACAGGSNICKQAGPVPSTVYEFYESNPTYTAPLTDSWTSAKPESQGIKSQILERASEYLSSLPQPLSFLVLRRNTLVWRKYFHGTREIDSHNVHSASKTILGLLYGLALNEEKIQNVDQKIGDLLPPRFKIPAGKKNLTIRHLLTMSSGFQWEEDESEYGIEDTANWIQSILRLPLVAPLGEKFNYSTGNTHLLSSVLTEATGTSTCDFARTRLFKPLNISFEHWGRDPQGYFSGGYNLYLKATELLKLGQLILQEGKWNERQVVPSEWIRSMVSVDKVVDVRRSYGRLIWLYKLKGHDVYKMWGYGGQFVYVIPDYDLVVVTTADTKSSHTELDGEAFLDTHIFPAIE